MIVGVPPFGYNDPDEGPTLAERVARSPALIGWFAVDEARPFVEALLSAEPIEARLGYGVHGDDEVT